MEAVVQLDGDAGRGGQVLLRRLPVPAGGAEANDDPAAAAGAVPSPQALQVRRAVRQVGGSFLFLLFVLFSLRFSVLVVSTIDIINLPSQLCGKIDSN